MCNTFILLSYDMLRYISVGGSKACPVFVYATLKTCKCAVACGNVGLNMACMA